MKFNFTGTKIVQGLKWAVTLVPAAAALYACVAESCGLPCAPQVTAISAGIVTFLMVVVGLCRGEEEE